MSHQAILPTTADALSDDHRPWTLVQLRHELDGCTMHAAGRSLSERQRVAINYLLYYIADADVRQAVERLTTA